MNQDQFGKMIVCWLGPAFVILASPFILAGLILAVQNLPLGGFTTDETKHEITVTGEFTFPPY